MTNKENNEISNDNSVGINNNSSRYLLYNDKRFYYAKYFSYFSVGLYLVVFHKQHYVYQHFKSNAYFQLGIKYLFSLFILEGGFNAIATAHYLYGNN